MKVQIKYWRDRMELANKGEIIEVPDDTASFLKFIAKYGRFDITLPRTDPDKGVHWESYVKVPVITFNNDYD